MIASLVGFFKVWWHCFTRVLNAEEHLMCSYWHRDHQKWSQHFCLCGYECKTPHALEIAKEMRGK